MPRVPHPKRRSRQPGHARLASGGADLDHAGPADTQLGGSRSTTRGFPSYTDEQMESVPEKGVGPQEEVLRPPVHTYHMNANDAKATIAYLKSLPARGQ